MTDKELDSLMDKLIEAIQEGALRPAFFGVAKDAVEHVLLRLGIIATDPDHVANLQQDFHHLRNTRVTWALTAHRMLEFEVWMKHQNVASEDIKKQLEDSKTARRWIRRRMDFFLFVLLSSMGTLIWFLLTHEVVIVVNP